MLSAKYKAHKLVNIIFYIIVFLIGFYMGVIGKNIGLKEIFNKFLFIDNVYAYNEPSSFYTPPTRNVENGTWKDTIYLVNLFYYINDYYDLGLSFNNYSNVIVFNDSTGDPKFDFLFNSTPLTGNAYDFSTNVSHLYIRYNSTASSNSIWTISYGSGTLSPYHNSNYYVSASNMNMTGVTYTLDFSSDYSLIFHENLFNNFSDFKNVCIDPHKAFIISTNEIIDNNRTQKDFFWFGGNITGLNRSNVDLNNTITSFEKFNINQRFFNSEDSIIDSKEYLSFSNVTDYSNIGNLNYYQWTAIPFQMWYENPAYMNNGNLFPTSGEQVLSFMNNIYLIYKFDDEFTITTYSSNGATRRFIDLTDISNDNLEVCFYINEIFDITNLEQDENGFYYGTISTPDGDKDLYLDGVSYDFFGNFGFESYGLSSIITAPLVAIRNIANGTCTPQSINILGKTITLPCGDTIFWGREDVQTFKIFWNMFFGGILCYGIGLSIFKTIRNFKDPDNDRVEVIDL